MKREVFVSDYIYLRWELVCLVDFGLFFFAGFKDNYLICRVFLI